MSREICVHGRLSDGPCDECAAEVSRSADMAAVRRVFQMACNGVYEDARRTGQTGSRSDWYALGDLMMTIWPDLGPES